MKSLILALSAAILFSSAAVAGDVVRQTSVSFGDLNLASKDGVAALHTRLVAAAEQVCADSKDTTQAPFYNECRQKAVQQAIYKVSKTVAERLTAAQ